MKGIVVKAHRSKYPDPIEFNSGEKVILAYLNREAFGWVKVKTQDKKCGWVPTELIDINEYESTAITRRNYNSRELNSCVDDMIEIVEELNSWYLAANQLGEVGWLPARKVSLA
ncbi:hypothetical protein N9R79_03015 [Vibrio sp.]|nr:hypothetical protein [Vibrio sp.]